MAGGNKQLEVKLKGNVLSFPTKIATVIPRGVMCNVNAAGFLCPSSDTASEFFAGMSEEAITAAAAVANGTVKCRVRRRGIFKMKLATTGAAPSLQGDLVYVDTAPSASVDGLVDIAANVTNHVLVGQIVKHGTDAEGIAGSNSTEVWVDIMGVANTAYSATFSSLSTMASHSTGSGAELVGVEENIGYGATPTLQDALEGLLANGHINVPLTSFMELDGTGLLQQSGDVAGFEILNTPKEMCIEYPDTEGDDAIITQVAMPQDFDNAEDLTVHFLVSKDGINNADVALDLAAYFVGVGDDDNADAQDTAAITLTNVASTPEELVFTVGASGAIATPCILNLVVGVVTAGTDNVHIYGVWIEYTRDMNGFSI